VRAKEVRFLQVWKNGHQWRKVPQQTRCNAARQGTKGAEGGDAEGVAEQVQ
jgi:hypothetical protein